MTRGAPLAWTQRCLGFSPNLIGTQQLRDEEWSEAFRRAFHAWQLVDCGGGAHPSIELFELRPTACGESAFHRDGPNLNNIYFTDQGWLGPQTSRNLDEVLARTRTSFDPSGEILDADIAINSGRKDFSVSDDNVTEDLVSVLTHEVGHFLGVAHSDVPGAVMYWQYGRGTVRRELQKDDVAAICAIYPPLATSTGSCDPTPRGGLETNCGPSPSVEAGCALGSIGDGNTARASVAIAGLIIVSSVSRRMRRS